MSDKVNHSYPRMHLQRDHFFSLNGQWEYQITPKHAMPKEEQWRTICVPYGLGSPLSQSKEQLLPGYALWYRHQFAYQPTKTYTFLHFQAVDTVCQVYLNGELLGEHHDGYTPFSFDVTPFLQHQNALLVKVLDDSEYGEYPYGKQHVESKGMFYHGTSGIWQDVWLEDVGEHYVSDIYVDTDIDLKKITIHLDGHFTQAVITVAKDGIELYKGITADKQYQFDMEQMHLWTMDDPYLYDLYIETEDDIVKSYFGCRKVSIEQDQHGYMRFCLNHQPIFLHGVLDQGYDPHGWFTYPSDQAIIDELQRIKQLGFNCLRKHVKVESSRYYYHCDRLGILVLQDFVSMGKFHWLFHALLPNLHCTWLARWLYPKPTIQMQDHFKQHVRQVILTYRHHPSIVGWTIFNEGWGQFASDELYDIVYHLDPTRLIDTTSGWFREDKSDVISIHQYFGKIHLPLKKEAKMILLSEFGGYAYVEYGHSFPKQIYGYHRFKDRFAYNQAIQQLYKNQIIPLIEKGLAGCIYTQLADIEDECNGLYSFDRQICKVDSEMFQQISKKCIWR